MKTTSEWGRGESPGGSSEEWGRRRPAGHLACSRRPRAGGLLAQAPGPCPVATPRRPPRDRHLPLWSPACQGGSCVTAAGRVDRPRRMGGDPGAAILRQLAGESPVSCVSQGAEAGQGEGAPGRGGSTTARHHDTLDTGVSGCVTSPAGNGERGKGTGAGVRAGRMGPLSSPQPAPGALGT